LIGSALIALLLADSTTASARVSVYSDSDQTTVISPWVGATAPVLGGTLAATYTSDVITSASVDVRTAASPATIHDWRNQFGGSYSRPFGETTVGFGYTYSQEHDYLSNGGALTLTSDFLQKNVTLGLSASYRHDSVWRTGDPNGARPLDVTGFGFIYTQVLGVATLGSLAYDLSWGNGFMASPYRFVPITLASDPGHPSVAENDPPTRTRHAFTVKVAQSLGAYTSLQADYRLYTDSWGLAAHTATARLILEPGGSWTIRLMGRAHTQSDASFYQPYYSTALTYMTGDRELSSLYSLLGGAKVSYAWPVRGEGKRIAIDAKVDAIYFGYRDYPYLTDRLAMVYELGLTLGI
jgi:hypothetical protein